MEVNIMPRASGMWEDDYELEFIVDKLLVIQLMKL